MARIVVPRLEVGTGAAASDTLVAAPSLQAIRIAYGVGGGRESVPTADDFRVTYHVTIPVFSLGGLDPDGVHEFDAGQLLQSLVTRAARRHWGVRLELELHQDADAAGRHDVIVDGPSEALTVPGGGQGESLAGGARSIVVATNVIVQPDAVGTLDGAYAISAGDATRRVTVALGRYEFEG